MTTPEEFRVLIESPESTRVEFKTASGVSGQSKTQFGSIRMRCQPIISTNALLYELLPNLSKTQFDLIKTQFNPIPHKDTDQQLPLHHSVTPRGITHDNC